jgi:hypothetical protein
MPRRLTHLFLGLAAASPAAHAAISLTREGRSEMPPPGIASGIGRIEAR